METRKWPERAVNATLFVLFCVVVVGPVMAAFVPAFRPGTSAPEGAASAPGVLTETRQWVLLLRTLAVAAGTAIAATLLGAPAGFFIAYEAGERRLPCRRLLAAMLAIPLLLPSYIVAVAWAELLAKNGWVTWALSSVIASSEWGGVFGVLEVYSASGTVLVLSLTYYPVIVLATAIAVRRLDGRLEEAALLAGGRARMFVHVTLPLIAPAILTGAAAVFLLTLLSFSVPSLFQTHVYAVEIYTRFSSLYDPGGAVLQSLPLVAMGGLALLVWARLLRPRYGRLSGVRRLRPVAMHDRTRHAAGLVYCLALAGLTAALPLLVLFVRALPLKSFLDAWATAHEEIINTLVLAMLSATVAVAFALALAYVETKRYPLCKDAIGLPRQRRWTPSLKRLYSLSVVPFLVSGPVLGVGLIQMWNHRGFPGLVYDSVAIVVLACVARYLVFAHFGLRVALGQLSPRLEEAAAVSGAGPWRRLTGIVLPLVRPAMIGVWGLVFVLAIGELDTVLLVCPPGCTPLSVRLFSLMHYGPSQLVAALSVITALLILGGATLTGLAYYAARRLVHERD